MQYLYIFFAFFTSFILQSTILKSVAIFGVTPNLILILVIAVSFIFKEKYGLLFGVLFGFVQDICFGNIVGISSLMLFLIGCFVSELKRYIYQDNLFTIGVISIVSVTGYHFLFWCIIALFGNNYHFMLMLQKLPIQIVYNSVLIFLVIKLIERMLGSKNDRFMD